MTDEKNKNFGVFAGNGHIDNDYVNLWYGNIDRAAFNCDFEDVGALIPSENSKDITLHISRNEITPDEAKELLDLLDVIYEDAKTVLENFAGIRTPVLSERLEFRLTADEMTTLTLKAEGANKTRSGLLRDMINSK